VWPNPLLSQISSDVVSFDAELDSLLDDLSDTLMSQNGFGIAAPQIGTLKRVFIMYYPASRQKNSKKEVLEIINPVTIAGSVAASYNEACFSVPNFEKRIVRNGIVEVEFYNRQGMKQHIRLAGMAAIVFQHEFDHLNGITLANQKDRKKK